MKVLTFASLYPNPEQPRHGIFVERRLRKLVATGEVESRVVAPVPWFPSGSRRFGTYGVYARVPARERRRGIEVLHPRYPVIPKAGMGLAPWLMRTRLTSFVRELRDEFKFEIIDAHYLYPDGVAAADIGERLGVPVVMTARGSDVNLIASFPGPRRKILRAAESCAAVITVSRALKNSLAEIGVDPDRITVLRNGVDRAMFRPAADPDPAPVSGRRAPVLLSVGHLVPNKGHHLVIRALSELPGATLQIVGDGPMRSELETEAARVGAGDRIRFRGTVEPSQLVELYSRADCTVLASEIEGMPNVVLESIACGTPVVATRVGGIPEVIDHPDAGVLVERRDPASIASGVRLVLERAPLPEDTSRQAARFDWDETTRGQIAIFEAAMRPPRAVTGVAGSRSKVGAS